jgi:CRISPR-associated protein Csd1
VIIQELCRYYDRLSKNPDVAISLPGFSREKIHAEIVLDKQGNLVQFNDLRIQKGKKFTPKEMIVPQANKRSGSKAYEKPNFLWDNTGFVLGADNKNDSKTEFKFKNFKSLHTILHNKSKDCYLNAMVSFLEKWDPQNAPTLNYWKELAGGNIVFRFDGDRIYFHEKETTKNIWLDYYNSQMDNVKGYCLVSGLHRPISRIHPDIKNVKNAQPKGAAIVSFNANAYESYGKEQNFNAPISEQAAFAYTTALNHLLNLVVVRKSR